MAQFTITTTPDQDAAIAAEVERGHRTPQEIIDDLVAFPLDEMVRQNQQHTEKDIVQWYRQANAADRKIVDDLRQKPRGRPSPP